MNDKINYRSEIIFLYDVTNSNPNGDPFNANRARIDEETGYCLVTDVRLKRTIRDYIDNNPKYSDGYDIFIKEVPNEDGANKNMKARLKDFLPNPNKVFENVKKAEAEGKKAILKSCFDIRTFGGVMPVDIKIKDKKDKDKSKSDKGSITITGPTQFGIGKSLHPVRENLISLSLTMATKDESKTGSLAEGGKPGIKYGLIGFHGVINENVAKETLMDERDVDVLLKGIWEGTRNLLTTSKKGHMPRLLIKVDYTDGYFVGDLLDRVSLDSKGKESAAFDSPKDYSVDVTELNSALKKADGLGYLAKVSVLKDDFLELSDEIYNAEALKIK